MRKHRRRVTIEVTPQTLYHLEKLAQGCTSSLGEVVDMLVTDYQLNQRYRNRLKERKDVYHVWK